MQYLFAKANQSLVTQLAWSKVLLAFDYDGTLAPIVNDRAAAQMRPRTWSLMRELCDLYPCAVISGRSVRDVRARVEGLPLAAVVGNHGLEPGTRLQEYRTLVSQIRPALVESLSRFQGVDVEDKTYSLAIHYRRARAKRVVRAAIRELLAATTWPVRVIPGKLVVNVVPQGAPHKGQAVERLRRSLGVDTVFFVGDDITDEDVFAIDQPGRFFGVRVGRSQSSCAAFFLRNQREMDRLLGQFVAQRRRRA